MRVSALCEHGNGLAAHTTTLFCVVSDRMTQLEAWTGDRWAGLMSSDRDPSWFCYRGSSHPSLGAHNWQNQGESPCGGLGFAHFLCDYSDKQKEASSRSDGCDRRDD